MRVEIVRLLGLCVALSALGACDGGDKGKAIPPQVNARGVVTGAPINTIDRSHAGEAAPAVVFEKRGGGKTSLADFRGQRVLVNLWATWCAPCLAEMPALDFLAVRRKGTLTVLPISEDLEGWRVVEAFFAEKKFQALEPRLDQPGSFAERLGAKGLPMSVLYDAQGREVWRVAGTLDWGSAAVEAAL